MSLGSISEYKFQPYVFDHKYLAVIAAFRLGSVNLGQTLPVFNLELKTCPLCSTLSPNNEEHLLITCPALKRTRQDTGISRFMMCCSLKNLSPQQMFRMYVGGLDLLGHPLGLKDFLQRGAAMSAMHSAWIAKIKCLFKVE